MSIANLVILAPAAALGSSLPPAFCSIASSSPNFLRPNAATCAASAFGPNSFVANCNAVASFSV